MAAPCTSEATSVPWRAAVRRALPWLPAALLLAALVASALAGRLAVDLWHLLAFGALAVAVLLARRLWAPAALVFLLFLPLVYHVAVELPKVTRALRAVPAGTHVRVEGTIRRQEGASADGAGARQRLLLGDVRIGVGERRLAVEELAVRFPVRRPWYRWRGGRRVRLGGAVRAVRRRHGRLELGLGPATYRFRTPAPGPWSSEYARIRLRDRAAYYLRPSARAVYQPIVLGMRERRTPEAREVVRAFYRVGVAHLFAISGLHVGLLYVLILTALHLPLAGLQQVRPWPRLREAAQVLVVLVLWGYLALIGFPVPAVRAAVMGTMLVWSDLWGTRTPRPYVLGLTAAGLLALEPTLLYDLSFQLSFLAYLFLVLALEGPHEARWDAPRRPRGLGGRLGRVMATNLWITLYITLGLWPLLAGTFGRVSLLVFAGNLLLVPLLGAVVLPAGIVAFLVSLFHLGTAPGGWLERAAFAALEWLLRGWIALVQALERLGGALVFDVTLDWSARTHAVYYAALLAGILTAHRLRDRLRERRGGRDLP